MITLAIIAILGYPVGFFGAMAVDHISNRSKVSFGPTIDPVVVSKHGGVGYSGMETK